MAMLAEPRQRKRYNLVPRGKALYEDDSRFGTKMLEKMGWSKGKGLGPNENGAQDFVRVRYKNDIEGLGYEQRDDQWTEHENSFNGLLKTLNGEADEEETHAQKGIAESEDDMPRVGFGFQNDEVKPKAKKSKKSKLKEKISGISLEEQSKQSRARVHYKKFTKGKDLSQYSEKDLANIFGKKAVDDDQEAAVNDLYSQLNQNLSGLDKSDGETTKEEGGKQVADTFGGVQTISTGLSVAEYFKIKMAALKSRSGQSNPEYDTMQQDSAVEINDNEESSRKKKKKKKRSHDSENPLSDVSANVNHNHSVKSDEGVSELMENVNIEKKKSKNKGLNPDEKSPEELVQDNNEVDDVPKEKKKTKKRKHKDCANPQNEDEEQPSEKKSNKLTSDNVLEIVDLEMSSKKLKSKSNKRAKNKENGTKDKPNSSTSDDDVGPVKTITETRTKKKRKEVSPKELVAIDYIKNLSFQQLKDSFNFFNTYQLSSFCAEKFRNINLNFFPRSTLSQIEGYGINEDIQLCVNISKFDEKRITDLWESTLSKYGDLEKPTKTYLKYIKETRIARKTKQKRPKLNVKTWKRKNAFAII